jgi:DNA adenine methylase
MLIKYPGSKWKLAPMLIALMHRIAPDARVYTEPYAGSLAVLWRKPPHDIEVVNDLDQYLITTYRVIADPIKHRDLAKMLDGRPTPEQFAHAHAILKGAMIADEIMTAWATVTFYRWAVVPTISSPTICRDNKRRCDIGIAQYHARLQNATICSMDAVDVIRSWDGPYTMHFVDPPYPVTAPKGYYRHHFTDSHYAVLIDTLSQIRGAAILTTYPHESLAQLDAAGYRCIVRPLKSSIRPHYDAPIRTELIYYRGPRA